MTGTSASGAGAAWPAAFKCRGTAIVAAASRARAATDRHPIVMKRRPPATYLNRRGAALGALEGSGSGSHFRLVAAAEQEDGKEQGRWNAHKPQQHIAHGAFFLLMEPF